MRLDECTVSAMGLDLTSLERDYRRDGFVLLPGFLPPDLVARLRATTHGLRARVREG